MTKQVGLADFVFVQDEREQCWALDVGQARELVGRQVELLQMGENLSILSHERDVFDLIGLGLDL